MTNAPARRLQPREVRLLVVLLCLGVSFRLVKISQPFIDGWSWRQSDVAMIAENFYRHGLQILSPQINWAGSAPGYVGTEFQLVSFIAALMYTFLDVHEWIGRSVSVLFFAVSIPFFYLLVRQASNTSSAFLAVGVYICTPLGIFSSRSFMPDMASLSFSIAALYLFAEWLERDRAPWVGIAACLTTSLAILVKLPAIIIGVPFVYMAWAKYGARLVVRRELWVFAAVALLFPLAWYVHAYLLSLRHAPYHFFGTGGIQIKDLGWYVEILHWTVTKSLTPVVFGAMLMGLLLSSDTTFGRVFHWWLLALLLFVVLAGEGNKHQWYQLPIVPVAAALAGRAGDAAWRRYAHSTGAKRTLVFAYSMFFATLALLSSNVLTPFYAPQRLPAWEVGHALHQITPPDALIIIADDGDPTAIYYSRRKGWHFFQGRPRNSQQAITQLEEWRKAGASYLSFTQYTFWWFEYYQGLQEYLEARYQRVRQTEDFIIFDMTVAKTE